MIYDYILQNIMYFYAKKNTMTRPTKKVFDSVLKTVMSVYWPLEAAVLLLFQFKQHKHKTN